MPGKKTKVLITAAVGYIVLAVVIACSSQKPTAEDPEYWDGRESEAIEITKNYAIDYGGMKMELIELMSLHLVLMAADDPGLKNPKILGWLASPRPDRSPSTYLCDLRVKFPNANDQIITYSFFTDVRTKEVTPANDITKSFWLEEKK
jgi:hypothetical protein